MCSLFILTFKYKKMISQTTEALTSEVESLQILVKDIKLRIDSVVKPSLKTEGKLSGSEIFFEAKLAIMQQIIDEFGQEAQLRVQEDLIKKLKGGTGMRDVGREILEMIRINGTLKEQMIGVEALL